MQKGHPLQPTPGLISLDSRARPEATIYHARESALVVTPTFNESANVRELIERFFQYVENVHLLVVDDNSPDGTADICQALCSSYPGLQVLRRTGPRGLGFAYLAGLRHGLEEGYKTIGSMDADLSHDPAYLPRMLALLEHSDVVIGSRYIRDGGTVNWGIRRILLSWLANKYAARLLGIPAHDLTSGFRLYRHATLDALGLDHVKSTGYSFLVELLYRAHKAGARITESPIIFYDRAIGASKLRSREIYLGAYRLFSLKILGVRVSKNTPQATVETRTLD